MKFATENYQLILWIVSLAIFLAKKVRVKVDLTPETMQQFSQHIYQATYHGVKRGMDESGKVSNETSQESPNPHLPPRM